MTFLCYLEDWFQDMRQLFFYIAEKSPIVYLLFYRALIGSIIYVKVRYDIYKKSSVLQCTELFVYIRNLSYFTFSSESSMCSGESILSSCSFVRTPSSSTILYTEPPVSSAFLAILVLFL